MKNGTQTVVTMQPSEPDRLYMFKEKIDELSIWEDEQGGLAWRKAWDTMLHPMTAEELVEKRNTWEEEVKQFEEEKKQYIIFFQTRNKNRLHRMQNTVS